MNNLAQKYRPSTLDEVVEQSVVIDIVRNICKSNEITNRNFLFIGPAGTGKAEPLDSLVLTTSGFKQMGDIRVGDEVITHKGNTGLVIGVYPQGLRSVYRIILEDGASIRVADNHLNLVACETPFGSRTAVLTTDYLLFGPESYSEYSIPVANIDEWIDKLHVVDPYRKSTQRRIAKIEFEGMAECQCIFVDHPDHTYISNDFIPTHNTTTARAIARTLNGGQLDNVIELDAASHSGVDAVRELINQMRSYPVGSKYKTFILDEVHSFSSNAWQALLKILEEQPARTIVMLCLAGDGLVPTNRGLKRLDCIQIGDQVWDGCQYRNVTNCFDKGVSSCLTVKLRDGTRFTCTPNHEFEVLDGDQLVWKAASDIELGDHILSYSNYPLSQCRDDISLEEAWMLGYITGNGNYTSHSLDLYTPFHKWDTVKGYLDKLVDQHMFKDYIVDGGKKASSNNIHDTRVHFYSDKYHPGMTQWYAKMKMDPDYTRGTKKIPGSVFEMSEECIKAFTDGWYYADGDGQCNSFFSLLHDKKKNKYMGHPFLYCSNLALIQSLKQLLQSIGIRTSISEVTNVVTEETYRTNRFIKPGIYKSYQIYIVSQVGFIDDEKFRRILIDTYDHMPTGKYKLKLSTLKIASLHARISPQMMREAGYDYPDKGIFVPVVSIEDAGDHHVYDIEVEGTHKFVYNGVIAHNCTTNPEKIPATILSRVQTFQLSKISLEGICNRLKYIIEQENKEGKGITSTEDAILYLGKLAQGGLRDSITNLDQCLSYSTDLTVENVMKALNLPSYDDYFDLLNAIAKKDNEKIVSIINTVYNSGVNFVKWFDGFFSFITNIVKFIYLQDINQTMIPSIYQDKIKGYGVQHAALCLKLSNLLVKMNAELKTTQYLQELAISYLCSVPVAKK